MRKMDSQRGIVIGPILFLIAIIGVLAAAIAAGTGGFSGSSSTASAKVLASAILDYAQTVQTGVDRVMANGCEDTEISFENPFVSGYTNPNAPSDKSCHVFDLNGGGISYKSPPQQALDNSFSAFNGFGKYIFSNTLSVKYIGNWQTKTSLIMIIPYLKEEIANKINEYSNVIGPMAYQSLCNFSYNYTNYFVGYYADPPCAGSGLQQYGTEGTGNLAGHTFGCLRNDVDSGRFESNCFKVLIAR